MSICIVQNLRFSDFSLYPLSFSLTVPLNERLKCELTYGSYHSYGEEKSPWEVPGRLRNIIPVEPLGLSSHNLSLVLFNYSFDLEAPVARMKEIVLLRDVPEQLDRQPTNLNDPVRWTCLKILQFLFCCIFYLTLILIQYKLGTRLSHTGSTLETTVRNIIQSLFLHSWFPCST